VKLTIDLSPLEESNIRGWVNKGLAEPDFAAHPYRLVLEERTRARFDQIAAQFAAPPVPPPTDPLTAFRARQAVSQNCAWVLISPAESGALRAVYGDAVSQYNQFYTVGGSGGLGIAERPEATSPSGYVYADAAGNWQPDVSAAADARVAELAAAQGRPVPPPI